MKALLGTLIAIATLNALFYLVDSTSSILGPTIIITLIALCAYSIARIVRSATLSA